MVPQPTSAGRAAGGGAGVFSPPPVSGQGRPPGGQVVPPRLAHVAPRYLRFDLPGRTLEIGHAGDVQAVIDRLMPLGFGAELQDSRPLEPGWEKAAPDDAAEARVLWQLLSINALMFVVEMLAGWWANSAALVADAADMLADAAVYGVALLAVGRDTESKRWSARLSGLLQLGLGVGTLTETGRRVLAGHSPDEAVMIGVSLLALAANVLCLVLVSKHRDQGVHMRASYIFSANDVLANLGVILAALLVGWTASPLADWIIGGLIGSMILLGAIRILRLR